MGLVLNTNISALNARNATISNYKNLNASLERLSTGIKLTNAADDSASLSIANSLRSQSTGLTQAIKNANDGISVMQIADSAIGEQVKIIETIKSKAIQASQDGQSQISRQALQNEISKLLEELDSISKNTSFNSQQLLSGTFINKQFQVGAYSNQTVKLSIKSSDSNSIGHTRYETGHNIKKSGMIDMKLFGSQSDKSPISIHNIIISHSANTGVGELAKEINKYGTNLQLRASYSVRTTGDKTVHAGNVASLKINGISIGTINDVKTGDSDGKVVASINAKTHLTGVEAYTDSRGFLNLKSTDGRGIIVSSDASKTTTTMGLGDTKIDNTNYGRLTLTRLDARDIIVSASQSNTSLSAMENIGMDGDIAQTTINMRESLLTMSKDQSSAMGIYDNANVTELNDKVYGVLSTTNSMNLMNIADSALQTLGKIRANIGATQKQLQRVISNLSVVNVNVRSAESNLRDVDFAEETREFQKRQILVQAGNYALSQANATQQLILKLLQ